MILILSFLIFIIIILLLEVLRQHLRVKRSQCMLYFNHFPLEVNVNVLTFHHDPGCHISFLLVWDYVSGFVCIRVKE